MRPWVTHWSKRAEAQLVELTPGTAARVDAAVMEYAVTGKGDVSRVYDDQRGMWLRASGYVLRLQLYPAYRIVSVRWMFKADP
jgi:hypothetical protein